MKASPLSKSKLLAYRQCEKRLWLEVKRPELLADSAATSASYAVGHQVGDLARKIFDPDGKGHLIDLQEEGFAQALTNTSELLQSFDPVFEAVLAAGDALALADILVPLNKRGVPKWRMIEVKSSTSVKDYHRADAAIQAYIALKMGLNLQQIEVACIDSSWTYPGGDDYRGLLKTIDLTEASVAQAEAVTKWVANAQKIVLMETEPEIRTGSHCKDPYACGFYDYCCKSEPQAEFPVGWLPDVRKKVLKELIIDEDVADLREIPNEMLNELQLRVKTQSLSGEVYFDKEGAVADLAAFKLPAYFLDFETINLAVPIWQGRRPYEQVPFQFSLHKMNRDGSIDHHSFLDVSGQDPAKPFAEKLIQDCGVSGPIYVYNIGFESARIRELAARFPELKDSLLALNSRMVDLLVVAKNRFYHPSQRGSWSIKSVLPAIASDLRYDNLDGVQDGGAAMAAFSEAIAPETSASRKAEIERQLLEYCRMDTVALIRLWQVFSGREALLA